MGDKESTTAARMCSGTPAPGSSSRSQLLLKQSDIAQSTDFEPSLTQMPRKYEAWLEDLQIPFETKILPSGVISRQLIFVVSPCQNIKATQLARGMMSVCSLLSAGSWEQHPAALTPKTFSSRRQGTAGSKGMRRVNVQAQGLGSSGSRLFLPIHQEGCELALRTQQGQSVRDGQFWVSPWMQQ